MRQLAQAPLLIAMLLVFFSAGCALFAESAPGTSCESNDDCFVAQGEICSNRGECIVGTAVDAAPPPDADVDAATAAAR